MLQDNEKKKKRKVRKKVLARLHIACKSGSLYFCRVECTNNSVWKREGDCAIVAWNQLQVHTAHNWTALQMQTFHETTASTPDHINTPTTSRRTQDRPDQFPFITQTMQWLIFSSWETDDYPLHDKKIYTCLQCRVPANSLILDTKHKEQTNEQLCMYVCVIYAKCLLLFTSRSDGRRIFL